MATKGKNPGKLIANNKKAYHDYFILEQYEAMNLGDIDATAPEV